jgi:hypothetical protein
MTKLVNRWGLIAASVLNLAVVQPWTTVQACSCTAKSGGTCTAGVGGCCTLNGNGTCSCTDSGCS